MSFVPKDQAHPSRCVNITPNNSVDLAFVASAVRVAVGGDLRVTTTAGDTTTIPGLLGAEQLVLEITRIHATGTTATGITIFA